MRIPKIFFYVGTWLLALTGVGDLIATDFLRSLFLNIEDKEELFALMAESDVGFLGLHTTLLGMLNGFSLGTGFLLLCFGVMNLIIARLTPETIFNSRFILGLDMLVSLGLLAISVNRFPAHGIPIFTLAFLAYGMAFIFRKQYKAGQPCEGSFRRAYGN